MKAFLAAALLAWTGGVIAAMPAETLRVATFNSSLNDDAGRLIARLTEGDDAARAAAAILQRVRPDIVLINEFDRDAAGEAARRFHDDYLGISQAGDPPLSYAYRFQGPVNTGEPSGIDLDGDGQTGGPNDAWGFGRHPGQFGMLLLSRFPIDIGQVRTFQHLRWQSLPDAGRPRRPDGTAFHSDAVWSALRLSSKSHWDIPLDTPLGPLHVLAAHPTPPVFDGPENLNGLRNHDELRLWKHYLDGGPLEWLCDDQGRCGGLADGAPFVVLGDLNADPLDGDTLPHAVGQLLEHPRVLNYPAPRSAGAQAAAAEAGPARRTDPATHTAQFGRRAGHLRVDYVLPSVEWEVVQSGVFWPAPDEAEAAWIRHSDHRLVWVDLRRPTPKPNAPAGP